MRISIRIKLFFWIASLSVFFVFVSLLLNTVLFKPYYLNRQERSFLALCEKMSACYRDDPTSFQEEAELAEYKEGFLISLQIESQGSFLPVLDQFTPDPMGQQRPGPGGHGMKQLGFPPTLFPDEVIRELLLLAGDDKYIFREIRHLSEMPRLTMLYRMEEGLILFVSRPMESVDESIAIAGRFSLITGLFFLFFGMAAAVFLSKFITHPVNELKLIAESMSELDFSKKYTVRSNDEIGELGQSINSLSGQLNQAINRLNQMNSDLIKEIEKERKIDEMRQNFIANVSHELRTPISLIEGYAEGLLDNIADDREKRISYCQVIMDETRKMEKHVEDLLILSQIQAGVLPLDYGRFNINELAEGVITKFSEAGNGEDFLFAPQDSLFVSADKGRTEQVIVNYVKNALRYGDGKKPVTLSTERRGEGKIRLSVFNSGPPIDEAHRERIWESYFKIDKARTRRLGGCGLGLSIVKAIMDQHENACGVDNRPDGVSFWFELDEAAH
ncbi:MAG: histidine kinase dimerization/phospho-acceptor domain-containing protein [Spirochaetales bacterium]|nr:histidine kinase dimerization/phospho-acceptor domain-containing protein [Spirochaetales bacterium]